MKPVIKELLNWLLFLAIGTICYIIFKEPVAFLGGYLGSFTCDYLAHKYDEEALTHKRDNSE